MLSFGRYFQTKAHLQPEAKGYSDYLQGFVLIKLQKTIFIFFVVQYQDPIRVPFGRMLCAAQCSTKGTGMGSFSGKGCDKTGHRNMRTNISMRKTFSN